MHIYRLNKPLFALDASHPARMFLEAFIECRRHFVGRELDGIDQQWWSHTDGRQRTFSSFAYESLAYDVILDGWLSNSPEPTSSELNALQVIPLDEMRMRECQEAALMEGNHEIVAITQKVLRMLSLWRIAIASRHSEE